jgi:hypothetical protein
VQAHLLRARLRVDAFFGDCAAHEAQLRDLETAHQGAALASWAGPAALQTLR